MKARCSLCAFIAGAVVELTSLFAIEAVPASAAWPERAVRIVVPSPPGGSVDLAARLYGERLAADWKRPAVIDNRPGADGILAVQALLSARDGHTLLFAFPGITTVVPLLHEHLPYDPVTDLLPISAAASDFLVVAVGSSTHAATLSDLVALAQARPAALNWASAPGAPYLTFLDFQKKAGIQMTFVSYRSPTSALSDLTSGQIQVLLAPLGAVLSQLPSGKIRLLAVMTPKRAVAVSAVPTAAEQGHPELTVEAQLGFFGQRGLSTTLREQIAADIRRLAKDSSMIERLRGVGLEACGSTPGEYAASLDDQRIRWAALSRAYGVHAAQ